MSDFAIKDESGDRKYFTIVPNYIVNHSTAYEQSLYLVMKRIAGEHGTCFASLTHLAKAMGVSRNTVLRTINKLLKRGWIKKLGTKPGKTHPTNEYVIVDLWDLNTEHYKTKKSSPEKQSLSREKEEFTREINKSSRGVPKEEQVLRRNNKYSSNGEPVAKEGKKINDLIALFEPVNPSYERLFRNTTQRKALERMVKKNGYDKIKKVIEGLEAMSNMPYAPSVTTPYQLEMKLGQVLMFAKKEAIKQNGGGVKYGEYS